jgi:hypothetical protein
VDEVNNGPLPILAWRCHCILEGLKGYVGIAEEGGQLTPGKVGVGDQGNIENCPDNIEIRVSASLFPQPVQSVVLSFGIHTLFEAYIPVTIDVRMCGVSQRHDHASVGQWSCKRSRFCLGKVASTGVEAIIFAHTVSPSHTDGLK